MVLRSREVSYTVEDLIKYGYIHKSTPIHNPYPSNSIFCPFDFYVRLGMIQSPMDFEGELEHHEIEWYGKQGKDALNAIMKIGCGRFDPNKVRDYLIEKGLWTDEDN
jgi:hypothetical protein